MLYKFLTREADVGDRDYIWVRLPFQDEQQRNKWYSERSDGLNPPMANVMMADKRFLRYTAKGHGLGLICEHMALANMRKMYSACPFYPACSFSKRV